MFPNQNYYYQTQAQQPTYYQQQQQLGLKGRPVASFEEARAITIDFDGSTFFFPDLANRRIYTKQINMDGTASLLVYELKETPINNPCNDGNYITREEFEAALKELRAAAYSQPVPQAPAPMTTAAKVETGLSKLF